MLKRLPIVVLIFGVAYWLRILHLLPVLFSLYVVAAAFENWNAARRVRRAVDQLVNPDQYLPGNRPHRRPPWAFTA